MLGQLRELTQQVVGAETWQLSDGQVREAVREGYAALQQMNAAYLTVVHELDQRQEAVAGARPGATGRTFLVHALRRTPVRLPTMFGLRTLCVPPLMRRPAACREWVRRWQRGRCRAIM